MRNTETLFLVGPGQSVQDFNPSDLQGRPTLTFSGTMDWFFEHNIYPTYWCFIDPFTVETLLKNIESNPKKAEWAEGLKDNTTLLYNHFQGTNEFYQRGLTTSQGQVWNIQAFGQIYFPQLKSMLKESISLQTEVVNEDYSLLLTREKYPLIKHPEYGKNTDKFTSYVLPLALYYFANLKEIISVGFGDYDKPRAYTTNAEGYEGFQLSYQKLGPMVKNTLDNLNILIRFINRNSYYLDLENV